MGAKIWPTPRPVLQSGYHVIQPVGIRAQIIIGPWRGTQPRQDFNATTGVTPCYDYNFILRSELSSLVPTYRYTKASHHCSHRPALQPRALSHLNGDRFSLHEGVPARSAGLVIAGVRVGGAKLLTRQLHALLTLLSSLGQPPRNVGSATVLAALVVYT